VDAGGLALSATGSPAGEEGGEGLAAGIAGLTAGCSGLTRGDAVFAAGGGAAAEGFGTGSTVLGWSVQALLAAASSATRLARVWLGRADRLKCRLARQSGRIAATSNHSRTETMWVIALEALVALCLLILIVWLTMGSSRRRDEEKKPPQLEHDQDTQDKRP